MQLPFLNSWGQPEQPSQAVLELLVDKNFTCAYCGLVSEGSVKHPHGYMKIVRKDPLNPRPIDAHNTHCLCEMCAHLTQHNLATLKESVYRSSGETEEAEPVSEPVWGVVIEAPYIKQSALNSLVRASWVAAHHNDRLGLDGLSESAARLLHDLSSTPTEWQDQMKWMGELELLLRSNPHIDQRKPFTNSQYIKNLRFFFYPDRFKDAIAYWSNVLESQLSSPEV
ncbi:hypothetical protein [Marinobacterium jannaschii]|uniref:hypothetical protein n=1 Tax=Marinobacterium jannaschii TaxID=64970 RepID=UPI000483F922|nr:hypothetical protein [Marinobacterium jannaschii]